MTLGELAPGRRLSEVGGPAIGPEPTRIGLVGCVKKKLAYPSRAEDLYVSTLFKGRRRYVERTCGEWFVLSALHGVVRPETVLEPYDVSLNSASRAKRRAWAATVIRQLEEELGPLSALTFEIHAGANYTDFGLVVGLQALGCEVLRPARGLKVGEQLRFYREYDAARGGSLLDGPGPPPVRATQTASKPAWEESDLRAALEALDGRPVVVPASDWPAGVDCLGNAGLYSWWVDEPGAADLSKGLGLELAPGRIYAGQAGATFWPSGKPGRHDLGGRIGGMHLNGRVRSSTFRLTLASILFQELGVQVQAVGVITPASETALSAWMKRHLSVAVCACSDRDSLEGLEREVLARLDPPLNLMHMQATPVRARLSELRRRISKGIV